MQVTFPHRPEIRAGVAYAPATVAEAIGVPAADFDDWLASSKIDLPVFTTPDGSRRILGDAVLVLMGAKGETDEMEHPLKTTGGLIAPDALYAPRETAMILGIAEKTLTMYRGKGIDPKRTQIGKLPRYRGRDIIEWMEDRAVN